MKPAWSKGSIAVFCVAFVLYLISSGLAHPTVYNNHVLLADAWLHGHIWIAEPSQAIDALDYLGRYYIIEAPLPAVLLLPFVAVFGTDANQTLVAVTCAALTVAAAYVLLERLDVSESTRRWVLITCATTSAATQSVQGDGVDHRSGGTPTR